jgi:hypothetical protein
MKTAEILRLVRPVLLLGIVSVGAAGCVVEPERPVYRERPAVVVGPAAPVVVERPAGFCYYHPYAPACR